MKISPAFAHRFLFTLLAAGSAWQGTNAALTVLHTFTGTNDGLVPYAAPVADATGTKLIGVTNSGGQSTTAPHYVQGIIYSVDTDGTGYSILHNFEGTDDAVPRNDGSYPLYGHLTRSGNVVYGMTSSGGAGSGTIWKINTDGTGYGVLKSFSNTGSQGFVPHGVSLTVDGTTIYGMTTTESSEFVGNQSGVVFKMDTDGLNYTVLHTFPYSNTSDENYKPYGTVSLIGSTLLGTTSRGGANNKGVIFKVDTSGSNYSVLHDFGGAGDGAISLGSLTAVGSTVYGMTQLGGAIGGGTIFKINADGSNYGVLHSFTALSGDGGTPGYGADLTLNGSTLYGSTQYGGDFGQGTIFQIGTDGSGYSVIHHIDSSLDGGARHPMSSPILLDNILYGTTPGDFSGVDGKLYSLELEAVPEPGRVMLLLAGLLAVGLRRRR